MMEVLQVVYDDPQQVHFLVRPARGATLTSAPVKIDGTSRRVLKVIWGGLYPEATLPTSFSTDEWRRLQRRVSLTLDGVELLDGQAEFAVGHVQAIRIGGETPGGAPFSGLLHSVQRLPLGNR